ncbi:MAG: lysophospholipid acyltransferase family protein [Magnetospiraceae bacterium]
MRWHKRVLRSEALRATACWVAASYVRLVHATGRWQVINAAAPESYLDQGQAFIVAFWHGRLLMMPKAWYPGRPFHMLISQHQDGQLIARTVGHFGIDTVAGSSSKGGAQALRAMVKALRAGECVGITPDGPRGPRMRASQGIVTVARMAGVPIIPLAYGATRGKLLGTWDRFFLPGLFARGVLVWGEPLTVPRDADEAALETARQAVEAAMNDLYATTDRMVNRDPVLPAEEAHAPARA